jgi:hypothetical protein
MEQSQLTDHPNISGWGADLDRKQRPAVPRERTPPRFINVHWTELKRQPAHQRIYHSTERLSLTPVFGTSAPPSGLSGRIRNVAYQLSENDVRHWLLLLFADRVNVIEGILSDLRHGHIPNLFAERGWKAEFKYNKQSVMRKAAVVGGLGIVAFFLLNRRKK